MKSFLRLSLHLAREATVFEGYSGVEAVDHRRPEPVAVLLHPEDPAAALYLALAAVLDPMTMAAAPVV